MHVGYIMLVAFSSDMRSKLKLETSPFVELPEFYVCFPILEVINHTKIELNYPNIKLKSDERSVFELGLLTVAELYNVLKNHSHIVKKINPAIYVDEFYRPKMSSKHCKKSYKFFQIDFCIIIRCPSIEQKRVFYNRSVLVNGPSSGKLLNIEIDASLMSFSERLTIYLVPYDSILWSGREAPIHYEIKSEPFLLSITYRVVRNMYQEKDFILSPCVDYRKQGFRCRLAKVKKCRDNHAYMTLGAPYSNGPQAITDNNMKMKTELYYGFLESRLHGLAKDGKKDFEKNRHPIDDDFTHTFIEKIRRVCRDVMPDCQETILIPRIEEVKFRTTGNSRFVLRAPDVFDYLNVYQPIFTWENVLIYIQSCVGFWIGISPISIINWLDQRNKRKNPKRRKINWT